MNSTQLARLMGVTPDFILKLEWLGAPADYSHYRELFGALYDHAAFAKWIDRAGIDAVLNEMQSLKGQIATWLVHLPAMLSFVGHDLDRTAAGLRFDKMIAECRTCVDWLDAAIRNIRERHQVEPGDLRTDED